MNLKEWADKATDFIKRYKHVEDVFTDKDGFAILSDMALVFGCEINVQLVDTREQLENTEEKETP